MKQVTKNADGTVSYNKKKYPNMDAAIEVINEELRVAKEAVTKITNAQTEATMGHQYVPQPNNLAQAVLHLIQNGYYFHSSEVSGVDTLKEACSNMAQTEAVQMATYILETERP